VFTIDGETGSSVVTLKQLKSVVEMIDDTPVKIDMSTGLMSLYDPNTVSLTEALETVSWKGITAKDAARRVLGADGVSEVRKIKRELTRLVDMRTAMKMQKPTGASAKDPDRWRLTNPEAGDSRVAPDGMIPTRYGLVPGV
jgi:hypothetical protein